MDQSNGLENLVSIRALAKAPAKFFSVLPSIFLSSHSPECHFGQRGGREALVVHDITEQLRCSNYENRTINVFRSTS